MASHADRSGTRRCNTWQGPLMNGRSKWGKELDRTQVDRYISWSLSLFFLSSLITLQLILNNNHHYHYHYHYYFT